MPLKIAIFLTALVLNFASVSAFSFGEETEITLSEINETQSLNVEIIALDNVAVNKNIIFDTLIDETFDITTVRYQWDLGDGNRQEGQEIVHSYAKPGEYEVVLTVSDAKNTASSRHKIFVYEKSYVLITDKVKESDKIQSFIDTAEKSNIFIELIADYSTQSDFFSEESLVSLISEEIASVKNSDSIVVWTEGSSGLTALSQLEQNFLDKTTFVNKSVIFISDQSFTSLKNIAEGVFSTIGAKEIILSRPEAIWVLLETETSAEFLNILEQRAIQVELVNDKLHFKIWNTISYFVNIMIERGVPSNTISLILMLPIIVTIVAFMKQVVGFTSLGVYIPSILALSFIALDLRYGLPILLIILIFGMLTRTILKRYRLLYIPRMAIVLVIVSLTILFILFLGSYFNIAQIVGIAVFPMLIMSTLVEKFVTLQSDKGFKSALIIILETIFIAVVCYFIVEWTFLKILVLGHPELILLFLLANIIMGRWTGLRVIEYIRFREIFQHLEE